MKQNTLQIVQVQPSDENLSSRAGLNLFAKYVKNIHISPIIQKIEPPRVCRRDKSVGG